MLQAVRWQQGASGEVRRSVRHLFLFIGADPNTDWLDGSGVALDGKGFVLTGAEIGGNRHLLETNCPGVFAIGDVRSGSVKRVAASVGEGAQVVAALHDFLASFNMSAGLRGRASESIHFQSAPISSDGQHAVARCARVISLQPSGRIDLNCVLR